MLHELAIFQRIPCIGALDEQVHVIWLGQCIDKLLQAVFLFVDGRVQFRNAVQRFMLAVVSNL